MHRILTACTVMLVLGTAATAQTPDAERLPSVELPAELDRVLRDYERAWRAGDGPGLAALFTPDGFVPVRGGWARGTAAATARGAGGSGDLRLRALAYATDGTVGYIVGAYGYGDDATTRDRGRFVLTLRRGPDGRWLIAADLD